MDSHEFGPEVGRASQVQASPSWTPLIAVRYGQMDSRLSIRMVHRTGRGTMRIDDACVAGCDSKWSVNVVRMAHQRWARM